jgi:UDP-N-acetylmuramyl pentapeptide synthase
MNLSAHEIAHITHAKLLHVNDAHQVENIAFDTRKVVYASSSMFVAIKSTSNDGHAFIQDAFNKGIRVFLVDDENKVDDLDKQILQESSIVLVPDTITALHELAYSFRMKMKNLVVGITGSNGKTIVKEWLYHLLYKERNVYRSPKSYNSQLGVALSLLFLSR